MTRGGWEDGKWALEFRRLLEPRDNPSADPRVPHNDDVVLNSGRTYGFRLKIYNASKTTFSESPILPLYIKPR